MPITKASSSAVAPGAKGELVVGTTTNDSGILAVGANDQVLTADSSTATGLKWAAPAAGSNWSLLNAGGTALTGAQTITVSGISGKDKIMILVEGVSSTSGSYFGWRFNASTTASDYQNFGASVASTATLTELLVRVGGTTPGYVPFARSQGASGAGAGYIFLTGCNSSGVKAYHGAGAHGPSGATTGQEGFFVGGYFNQSSTISSISVFAANANFDAGTVYVYTSA